MNQKVSPAVVGLVLAILGAFLVALFYVNDRSLSVDHLRLAALHPDGSPVVMMGNQLHKLDLDRQREEVIALSDLGIASTVGGFAFFGNGDLLVVADEHRPGLWEKLVIWGRSANREYARSERNQLLRCDLEVSTCQRFSPDLPDFTRTFRLFVDQQTDEVYVADTSRHRLLKLDGEGRQLAAREGFKFPNQLRLIDGELWLADTNRHRIKRLDGATEHFGETLEDHRIDLGFGHRWPSDMMRMGERWWALVHDQDMANGQLAVYDSGWQLLHTLPLPPGADAMGIVAVVDRVLITDYGRFALYLFNERGERLDTPGFPVLGERLSVARESHQYFQWASWGLQGLLFLLIAVGLLYAVIQQKRHSVSSNAVADARAVEVPAEGLWLLPNKTIRLAIKAMELLLALLLVMVVVLYFTGREKMGPLLSPSLLMPFLLLFVIMLPIKRMLRSQLGLLPEKVVLINGAGHRFESAYADIQWIPGGVKIAESVVALSHGGRRGLFEGEPIDTLLKPRLLAKNRISQWQMFKYQWQSPDNNLKFVFALIAILTLVMLVLDSGKLAGN